MGALGQFIDEMKEEVENLKKENEKLKDDYEFLDMQYQALCSRIKDQAVEDYDGTGGYGSSSRTVSLNDVRQSTPLV